MVDPATRKKPRKRAGVIALRAVAWIIAIMAALTAPVNLVQRPDAAMLRTHPVGGTATVVRAYINGMGGDPMVDYEFVVNGRKYTGSGTGGELRNGDVLRLARGAKVRIQYAAADPSLSCTCDARTADSWRMPTRTDGGVNPAAGLLIMPLVGITVFEIFRRIGRRRLPVALAS